MPTNSTLNLAFFSSSDFTIPILESLKKHQNQNLSQIVADQLKYIQTQNIIESAIPDFWKEFGSYLDHKVLDRQLNLKIVVSQPDREYRAKLISNPIVIWARDNQVDLFTPHKINVEMDTWKSLAGDGLDFAIVASFGQILSQEVLNTATYGFLNWHPSLLPLYRGPTPMQSAIANGDKSTGLSWIEMIKQMDAGDIWLQLKHEIEDSENILNLSRQMGVLGSHTWALPIAAKLLSAHSEQLQPLTQNPSEASFCKLLTKQNRLVYPSVQSAETIYNHFKAYLKFPGTSFNEDWNFFQEVKIIDCAGWISDGDLHNLKSESEITYEQPTRSPWLQITNQKTPQTFLKCAKGYLKIEQIGLASGKKIQMKGFVFK